MHITAAYVPAKSLDDLPPEILMKIFKLLDVNSKFSLLNVSQNVHDAAAHLLSKQKILIFRQMIHPKVGLSSNEIKVTDDNLIVCMDLCQKYMRKVVHFSIALPFQVEDYSSIMPYMAVIAPDLISLEFVVHISGLEYIEAFEEIAFPSLKKLSIMGKGCMSMPQRFPSLEVLTIRNRPNWSVRRFQQIYSMTKLKEFRIHDYHKLIGDVPDDETSVRTPVHDFVRGLLCGASRRSLEVIQIWNPGKDDDRALVYLQELESIYQERGFMPAVEFFQGAREQRYFRPDIII
jgi:hypothetical protein